MNEPLDAPQSIARQLFESLQLGDSDSRAQVERALSPDYWRGLATTLTVDAPPVPELVGVRPQPEETRTGILDQYTREGYMRFESLVPAPVTARMKAGVMRLLEADWPAIFTWMYDEFWRVPRLPPFVEVCSAILGERYYQTPYVWTHVVSGQRGAGGWPPHVDNPGPDARVTLWIPLSDATLDIGCMCVIPRHLAPADVMAEWHTRTAFTMQEVEALLKGARPLVAPAGTALSWDARLVHWGAARQAAGEPRISFSMEFIGASGDPKVVARSLPAWDAPLPSFEQRLRIIADNITTFHTRELRVSRYTGLARELLDRLGPA